MQQINTLLRRLPVWLVYVAGVLPAGVLFYQALNGDLGVDPVKALEHRYGELALQLLVLTLAVTPLRRLAGLNLMRFRRAIGLLCFFYVVCHLMVWLVLDVQLLDQIIADIVKRPYITIGMVGFVLMVPLAVTSNNMSVRRLGPKWRQLHRLTYPTALLGALHYVMLAKGFQLEPLIYLALIGGLLVMRLPLLQKLRVV